MFATNYFKKKFGGDGNGDKDVSDQGQFYSPLRIGLHSTIVISTVDWIVIKPNLNTQLDMPKSPFSVMAIETVDLDKDKMYIVYLQDSKQVDFILRLFCTKNHRSGDEEISEAIVYQQVVTINPDTEASWDRTLANIGFQEIEVDDFQYNRVWGDRFTEKAEFTDMPGTLILPTETIKTQNQYLLYEREVENPIGGDTVKESLLVGIEEDDNAASIVMQVGYPSIQPSIIQVQ